MSYPVLSYVLVRAREGEIILYHRRGKEGGVEVNSYFLQLCVLYPCVKVLRLKPVALNLLAAGYRIYRVEIYSLLSGNEREHLVKIRHQLLRRSRLSGVVSGRLYTAGERSAVLKARDVVALPAVYGNRDRGEGLYRLLGVYTVLCIYDPCVLVCFHSVCSPLYVIFIKYPNLQIILYKSLIYRLSSEPSDFLLPLPLSALRERAFRFFSPSPR